MMAHPEETIYEEYEVLANRSYSKLVKISFASLVFIILLSLSNNVLFYLNLFESDLVDLVLDWSYHISFCGCILTYLVWYYKINKNHQILSLRVEDTDYLGSIFIWFLPGFHIVLPYFRLKVIRSEFERRLQKVVATERNRALNVWMIAFFLYYGAMIYMVMNLPFFAYDVEMFYLLNPKVELLHHIIFGFLEIIGLCAMFVVVDQIQHLETEFINGEDRFDLEDHLVE